MSLGLNTTLNNKQQQETSNSSSPVNCTQTSESQEEWVEIIEPKSRTRIYANLETGVCAKHPPEGVIVSKAEDFTDHWWEIYDKNTGRPYYYNPEQQKTAWTCPKETTAPDGNNKRRVLIIPVSKLQNSRRLSSPINNGVHVEKCDASTQTIASNLITTGTQTISESSLVEELSRKLKTIDTSTSSSSCTHSSRSSMQPTNYKSPLAHRQLSDFVGRNRNVHSPLNIRGRSGDNNELMNRQDELDNINVKSSQTRRLIGKLPQAHSIATTEDQNYINHISSRDRSSWLNRSKRLGSNNNDELLDDEVRQSATSTAAATSTFKSAKPPIGHFGNGDGSGNIVRRQIGKPHTLTTNNLSHYLVREAQSMGIALISDDDEIDDDELASEDDCVADDDEDTDLRDDASSSRGGASDINNSQEFADDSSEGWKSLSDHGSPNGTSSKRVLQQSIPRSPILCEAEASFTYNELIDDRKDPASCMSQQLDHRKLVENFKNFKSRQSSSFGLHDSLTRSHKLDPNNAVQRIKTAADNYFGSERDSMSERRLRQLSTLSTLPRPHKETKDKVALSKRDSPGVGGEMDADYDVVEENCSYYSGSSRVNQVNQSDTNLNNTSSMKTDSFSEQSKLSNSHFDRNKSTRGSTFSVESFARENLARHPKKGALLFNRKVKWSTMINWTKNSIKQPMISSVSSDLSSESIASFKLIQQFMGDRKLTITKKYRQILAQSVGNSMSSSIDEDILMGKSRTLSRPGSMNISLNNQNPTGIPDKLRDVLAFELIVKGCSESAIRDEIYVQLARQLTGNPSHESTEWGLILMSILLNYFSPSTKFAPFLLSFLETHSHPIAQDVCLPRLEKRLRQNWISYCRKPIDSKEISIVRLSITKWPQYCGIFGESLERIMTLQACSPYLKTLRLPWILTTLAEKLVETGGMETEGIFRCAADHDIIAQLRLEIDCVDFRKITDAKQLHSLLSNVEDPHVVAGLLKLFFRQLNEPVFPSEIYDLCLQNCQDSQIVRRIFDERLPNINKDVVAYLIRLLQQLSQPEKVTHTKMDNSNLSMVWAPNLLRVPEPSDSTGGSKWTIAGPNASGQDESQPSIKQQSMSTSQTTIFEQTRQEMQFIRSLIIHLDTSFISGLK